MRILYVRRLKIKPNDTQPFFCRLNTLKLIKTELQKWHTPGGRNISEGLINIKQRKVSEIASGNLKTNFVHGKRSGRILGIFSETPLVP